MGQDVGVSLSSVPSVFRRFTTPRQRRELQHYARFALRRPTVALSALADGLFLRRPGSGRPPAALVWPPDAVGDTIGSTEGSRLPLREPLSDEGGEGVRLATRSWDLANGPPWTGRFSDPEDTFAAHRFGWTLPMLRAQGARASERLVELALAWQADHPQEPGAPGWDSYSVAERTVHWCYLLACVSNPTTEAILLEGVRAHAAFLRAHLEFRGESTNNHLINDGRALYHAGVVADDASLRGVGRHLVDYGAAQMFVSGFLREGASHYHLLLCRTFAELLVAARAAGDDDWSDGLCEQVEEMIRAAIFFATPTGPRLYGDLSPDVEPSFLSWSDPDAVHSSPSDHPDHGWRGLLSGRLPLVEGAAEPGTAARAGYYRARVGQWDWAAFVNPLGYVAPWSHAHADLGSFVLDWGGQPLLVDCGRSTYAPSSLGDYGRSVRSHNGVSIDRHEPCVTHGLNGVVPILAPAYHGRPPRTTFHPSSHEMRLRVTHDGFGRLGSGLTYAREVMLDDARCQVTDVIGGRGRRSIETFFHFHPSVTVSLDEPTVARCVMPGRSIALRAPRESECRLARGEHRPDPAGWFSSRYGQAEPCWTLVCRRPAVLPLEQQFELFPI